jgi:ribonuclease P protein component
VIRATFRRFERLSRQEDFSRTRKEGRRRAGRHLLLWSRGRGEEPPRPARLGIVVARRHGIAARRNLFKRRVREAFRRNKADFPRGWDFVVTPKDAPKEIRFPASFAELSSDLLTLARADAS